MIGEGFKPNKVDFLVAVLFRKTLNSTKVNKAEEVNVMLALVAVYFRRTSMNSDRQLKVMKTSKAH